VLTTPVAISVTLTIAPWIAACSESVTVPVMLASVAVWANAPVAAIDISKIIHNFLNISISSSGSDKTMSPGYGAQPISF
jgi:hypothetical protein